MNATKRLIDTYNELIQDCERAEEHLRQSDTQYSRRVSIRAVFAMIEGLIYMLKQVVLSALAEYPEAIKTMGFEEKEIVILREKKYSLKENGEVQISENHLPTLPNLRFAVAVYARIWGLEYKLDCNVSGWAALKSAVGIRNRITHPKGLDDLIVNDIEMEKFIEGAEWHRQVMTELLDQCNNIMRRG